MRRDKSLRWVQWCALGLAVRAVALVVLHDQTYILDHLSYVQWGRIAAERGPLSLYDRPERPVYAIYSGTNAYAGRMMYPQPPIPKHDNPRLILGELPGGGTLPIVVPAGQGNYEYAVYEPMYFNYPPLAAYLYWVLGSVHRKLDPQQEPDTRLAHGLFALPAILCDLLLAVVAARALHVLGGALAPAWGLCLILFCPALIWDSSVWLQTDSLGLLMIASTLLLLARDRIVWASALCGLSLMVKPQAVWVVPLVTYMAVKTRSVRTVALSALSAAAVVAVISTPFLLSSGLLWFRVAYLDNATLYPQLSLNAYNPWWIVAVLRAVLLTEPTTAGPTHISPTALLAALFDDRSPWLLGVTPRTAGFVLLAGALLFVATSWYRYTRVRRANIFIFGFLIYLAAFLFPTEVHERYIIYMLPLAVVAATDLRSVRRGLWAANLAALVNLTGYVLFNFPFSQADFSARHWAAVWIQIAVSALTLVLFIMPAVEMWRMPLAVSRPLPDPRRADRLPERST